MKPPNLNPPLKDLRLFALLLLLPALLCFYKFHLPTLAYILGALTLIGSSFPKLIKPVHNLLVLITYPIGFVINHLLLTLIYYLVLTPIALVKGRPLNLRFPPLEKTNFTPLPKKEAQSYYDPF